MFNSASFDVMSCFRFVEKGNLEVLLFTLQSKMRANNQKPYTPKEGKMISDINKAWERLEKAEHERELALREELIRQEKLEQLAARFNRKASMRETWLSENQRLVSQVRCATVVTPLHFYFPETIICSVLYYILRNSSPCNLYLYSIL